MEMIKLSLSDIPEVFKSNYGCYTSLFTIDQQHH